MVGWELDGALLVVARMFMGLKDLEESGVLVGITCFSLFPSVYIMMWSQLANLPHAMSILILDNPDICLIPVLWNRDVQC